MCSDTEGAADVRDNQLFTQPDESHLGECPICCLPLPLLDLNKWSVNPCCCKRICQGCSRANILRELEQGQHPKCPYCREQLPKTKKDIDKNYMERAEANDPVALNQFGSKCDQEGDSEGAFEYYRNAAALGNMMAHYNLSIMYQLGEGVEKDTTKEMYHLEEAAIGGHPEARYNLGCYEGNAGRINRAMNHFIIAANLGLDNALEMVQNEFRSGVVSKEDYEAALRGHQRLL